MLVHLAHPIFFFSFFFFLLAAPRVEHLEVKRDIIHRRDPLAGTAK